MSVSGPGFMPRDWAMFAPDTYHSAHRGVQATRWFALRYASNAFLLVKH
jgi:hypothetical protein